MKENYVVCHCENVSFGDIEDALHACNNFDSELAAFEGVKQMTHCSTGCGGCHDKVMEIISELMMNPRSEA